MKGRIASRAHSFKEGLLEAFGHHSGASLSPVNGNGHNCAGGGGGGNGFFAGKTASSPAPSPNNNIHLAKQTGSTDNLIGERERERERGLLSREIGRTTDLFMPSLLALQDIRSRSTRPRASSEMSSWR